MKFFGCIDRPGHYWFDESLAHIWRSPEELALPKIDTGYCPKESGYQTNGEARLVYENGYTILAFWDRSVDSRPGGNAAFVQEGKHDFVEMLRMAGEKFPTVMPRFGFPIVVRRCE